MRPSYDLFTAAFLAKIREYEFLQMMPEDAQDVIDGYLKAAVTAFKKNCRYDLFKTDDNTAREFVVDVAEDDIDELVEIISEGMVVQWMKPFLYRQENLENLLNTRDFTLYSPANLLLRIGEAYRQAKKDYTQMIREYSYNHGDLTTLHTHDSG